ncbi:hypothetical protein ACN6LA_005100, partial [Streptomyces sp. SAS_269]
ERAAGHRGAGAGAARRPGLHRQLDQRAGRRRDALLGPAGRAEEAAALIEEAGGRAAALAEARAHTAVARELISGLPPAAGAAGELLGLLDHLEDRDL